MPTKPGHISAPVQMRLMDKAFKKHNPEFERWVNTPNPKKNAIRREISTEVTARIFGTTPGARNLAAFVLKYSRAKTPEQFLMKHLTEMVKQGKAKDLPRARKNMLAALKIINKRLDRTRTSVLKAREAHKFAQKDKAESSPDKQGAMIDSFSQILTPTMGNVYLAITDLEELRI